MKGILKEEFSRAFFNKRFWIVTLLAVISFTYGFTRVMEIQPNNVLGAVMTWQNILRRGSYGFFAALMAGLPFADSLLLDRRHHFIDQILLRCRYPPISFRQDTGCPLHWYGGCSRSGFDLIDRVLPFLPTRPAICFGNVFWNK